MRKKAYKWAEWPKPTKRCRLKGNQGSKSLSMPISLPLGSNNVVTETLGQESIERDRGHDLLM